MTKAQHHVRLRIVAFMQSRAANQPRHINAVDKQASKQMVCILVTHCIRIVCIRVAAAYMQETSQKTNFQARTPEVWESTWNFPTCESASIDPCQIHSHVSNWCCVHDTQFNGKCGIDPAASTTVQSQTCARSRYPIMTAIAPKA